jgi:hypothetical protein
LSRGLGGVSDVTAVIRTSSIFGTRGIAAMLRYRGVRGGALSLTRNVTLCLKETWAPIAMGTPYLLAEDGDEAETKIPNGTHLSLQNGSGKTHSENVTIICATRFVQKALLSLCNDDVAC